jgi:hypothetical protein
MTDKKDAKLRRLGVKRREQGAEKPKTRSLSAKNEERAILKKLLTHHHLSVPEMKKLPEWRKANGFILRDLIVEELRAHGRYPPDLKPDGDLIHGILKRGPAEFRVYLTGEVGVGRIEQISETVCADADKAAILYLEQNFGGEEGLDGLTIDWSPKDRVTGADGED